MDNKKGSKSSIYFCDDVCKNRIIFIKNTQAHSNKNTTFFYKQFYICNLEYYKKLNLKFDNTDILNTK